MDFLGECRRDRTTRLARRRSIVLEDALYYVRGQQRKWARADISFHHAWLKPYLTPQFFFSYFRSPDAFAVHTPISHSMNTMMTSRSAARPVVAAAPSRPAFRAPCAAPRPRLFARASPTVRLLATQTPPDPWISAFHAGAPQ